MSLDPALNKPDDVYFISRNITKWSKPWREQSRYVNKESKILAMAEQVICSVSSTVNGHHESRYLPGVDSKCTQPF